MLLTYLHTYLTYLLTYILYLLTCLLMYLFIPRNRVLLEKLTGPQLVKKFPGFYGTRKFITTFTSVRHLPYPEPARSSPCPHIPLPEDPS